MQRAACSLQSAYSRTKVKLCDCTNLTRSTVSDCSYTVKYSTLIGDPVAARVHKDSQLPQRRWSMEPGFGARHGCKCMVPVARANVCTSDCWDRGEGCGMRMTECHLFCYRTVRLPYFVFPFFLEHRSRSIDRSIPMVIMWWPLLSIDCWPSIHPLIHSIH